MTPHGIVPLALAAGLALLPAARAGAQSGLLDRAPAGGGLLVPLELRPVPVPPGAVRPLPLDRLPFPSPVPPRGTGELPDLSGLPEIRRPVPRDPFAERIRENAIVADRARLLPRADFARQMGGGADVGLRPGIVQLARPVDPVARRALAAAGVTIEAPAGGTTYVATLPPDFDPDTLGELVVGGRVLAPEDKLRVNLGFALRQAAEAPPVPPVEAERFLVEIGTGVERGALAEALEARGAGEASEILPGLLSVAVPRDRLADIAALGAVISVDLGPPPFLPLMNGAREAIGADAAQGFALDGDRPVLGGLTGQGVRIAIFDDGVDEGAHDFCDIDGDDTASRFFHTEAGHSVCDRDAYADDRQAWMGGFHGTHVAGIAAGSGRNSARAVDFATLTIFPPFSLRGVAPRAAIGDYTLRPGRQVAPEAMAAAFGEDSADVSNHSHVEGLEAYGAWQGYLDALVSGRRPRGEGMPGTDGTGPADAALLPRRPQVWSAGNNGLPSPLLAGYGNRRGYYSVLTHAKNTISVGAYDTALRRVSADSSLGPTLDGRIKPDLVAPGCHDSRPGHIAGVMGPVPGGQGYIDECGTSMAAPVVTGLVALIREAIGSDPLPSTYKAILVATARDLVSPSAVPIGWPPNPQTGAPVRYGEGPDLASGFGLVNAPAAIEVAAAPGAWHEGVLSATGETALRCIDVPEGSGPLRVALAWDDVPSPPTDIAARVLVNDLDLSLEGPSGQTYLPWTIPVASTGETLAELLRDGVDALPAGPQPFGTAVRDVDHTNTVELAEVGDPAPGRWTLIVRAGAVQEGPQDFSLASGIVMTSCGGDG